MTKIRNGYEFTERQEEAIGQLVVDYWGANIQTGFDENNVPYIYFRKNPTAQLISMSVSSDGTVVTRDP